jgi:hypothetical protein
VPKRPDFLSAAERSTLERAFLDFLSAGGFPEAQGLDTATRWQLLKDYVDVAMLRDVVERHAVSNVAGFRHIQGHGAPTSVISRGLLPGAHGLDGCRI